MSLQPQTLYALHENLSYTYMHTYVCRHSRKHEMLLGATSVVSMAFYVVFSTILARQAQDERLQVPNGALTGTASLLYTLYDVSACIHSDTL